jgi:hypothetical protein
MDLLYYAVFLVTTIVSVRQLIRWLAELIDKDLGL